jgi:hypothetical protein
VKLTNEMRRTVVTKAMAGFMQIEKDIIEQRRLAFGTEVYEHTYGKDEPLILQVSPEWRQMDDHIVIACDGFEVKRHNCHPHSAHLDASIDLGRDRPFPGSYSRTDVCIRAAKKDFAEHPLYKKSQKLVKDYTAIIDKEEELRSKISALLRSCNTDRQLELAWPEGMQFLPVTLSHSTALVPVGLSDQINKALGIPPKASAATTAVRKAATH